MDDLKQQELFEIEVLDLLNSKKILPSLVFCGGTMLRLCYELPRYSVDLDFWLMKNDTADDLFARLSAILEERYTITDAANKHNTLLFEIHSAKYPRHLKIEIRKNVEKIHYEPAIAFSTYTNLQVPVNALTLDAVMTSKQAALIDRTEVRDAFDIEFLIRRGIPFTADTAQLTAMNRVIDNFTKHDINTKLGSLLPADLRAVYTQRGFSFLKMKIEGIQS